MFGVQGQYLFGVEIDDRSLISDINFLENFVLKQQAMNSLPVVKLEFITTSVEVVSRLNEGNTLRVSLGTGADYVLAMDVFLTSVDSAVHGYDQYLMTVEGMLDRPEYVVRRRCRTSGGEMTALEAVRRVAEPYFEFRTNARASQDEQIWVQPSIPDRHFVTHLWRHMNLPGSWPAIAVTAFGPDLRVVDINRLQGQDPDWDFGEDGIPVMANPTSKIMSGAWNQFHGYPTFSRVEDWDSGLSERQEQAIESLWQGGRNPNRHGRLMESRIGRQVPITGNHHRLYHQVQMDTYGWAALNSSFRLALSVKDRFRDYHPLDKAFVFLPGSSHRDGPANRSYSGVYIVDTVIHRIKDRQYSATVVLAREAPAEMQGEFA